MGRTGPHMGRTGPHVTGYKYWNTHTHTCSDVHNAHYICGKGIVMMDSMQETLLTLLQIATSESGKTHRHTKRYTELCSHLPSPCRSHPLTHPTHTLTSNHSPHQPIAGGEALRWGNESLQVVPCTHTVNRNMYGFTCVCCQV